MGYLETFSLEENTEICKHKNQFTTNTCRILKWLVKERQEFDTAGFKCSD